MYNNICSSALATQSPAWGVHVNVCEILRRKVSIGDCSEYLNKKAV